MIPSLSQDVLQVTTELFCSYLHSTFSWYSHEFVQNFSHFLDEPVFLQHCDCFLKILQRCFYSDLHVVCSVGLFVCLAAGQHRRNYSPLFKWNLFKSHYALEGIQITNYLTVGEKAIEGKTIRPSISSSCLYLRWIFQQGVKESAIFIMFDFNRCKNEPLSTDCTGNQ